MAGSLNHIIADDGSFTMRFIDDLGDAQEALEQCHQIIAALLNQQPGLERANLRNVLNSLGYAIPVVGGGFQGLVNIPVIQPALHGMTATYSKDRIDA